MSLTISSIELISVIVAGAISFASPCVLPLVPAYISFMSGGIESNSTKWIDRLQIVGPALLFVLGFTTVFVLLGLSAQVLGGILQRYQRVAEIAGGTLVFCFGLAMSGLFRFPALAREWRVAGPDQIRHPLAAYFLGLSFAFAWTPCIGPVLGSVLAVTAISSGNGAILLGAYALGLGIPFLLTAVFSANAAILLKKLTLLGAMLNILAGIVMMAMGTLMVLGRTQIVAIWLLETFPRLGRLG